MIVAIDAGNSRIKWGLYDTQWQAQGAVPTSAAAQLAQAWQALPIPDQVLVSNVAGAAVRSTLERALACWPLAPIWIASRAYQCGVKNGYDDPTQIGCDRWAALIGAHHLHRGDCLVVNAGTALTVDALSRDGEFLGGVIVPGLELMVRALAQNTAALPELNRQCGGIAEFPRNTADAMASGALHALCGAVERMARAMARRGMQPHCLLSGGAAREIAPQLNLPLELVDNLVLEGLVQIVLEKRR